jgi:peptidoglycan/xylan/chitin deacetylase (PgdA/CDA1 family)
MRRAAKTLIAFAVAAFDAAVDLLRRLVGLPVRGRAVVIYYHSVPAELRAAFAHQMDLLLARAKPIRADRTEPPAPGERLVAVTFDDGFIDFAENALPELQSRGIPAVNFIPSGHIGKTAEWIGEGDPKYHALPIMSAERLRQLPADLVTIGSHTISHPYLPELSEAEARRELTQSKRELEAALGRPVESLSFPFGGHNAAIVDWARQAGYRRVFSILPHLALVGPNEFLTGRVGVDPDDSPLQFKLKIAGAYRWLPAAIRFKRALRGALRLPAARPNSSGGRAGARGA